MWFDFSEDVGEFNHWGLGSMKIEMVPTRPTHNAMLMSNTSLSFILLNGYVHCMSSKQI